MIQIRARIGFLIFDPGCQVPGHARARHARGDAGEGGKVAPGAARAHRAADEGEEGRG